MYANIVAGARCPRLCRLCVGVVISSVFSVANAHVVYVHVPLYSVSN
jgi:hypothetical protein